MARNLRGYSGGRLASRPNTGAYGNRYQLRLFCPECKTVQDAQSKLPVDGKSGSEGRYILACGHERTQATST